MIHIEDLLKVKRIISHANCPDGTISAMICKVTYSSLSLELVPDEPEIDFMHYKSPEHDELEITPGMMFVDFTPPYARWPEFEKFGTIVLDHHASAMEHIIGNKVIFGEGKEHSGASLCFKHVMTPLSQEFGMDVNPDWEVLSDLARIRDTWQKDSPDWDRACRVSLGVKFLGQKYCLSMAESGLDLDLIEKVGDREVSRVENKSKVVAEGAFIVERHGLRVAFYNNTEFISSDVGEILGENNDFSVSWSFFEKNGTKCLLSMRSRNGFDVSKVASALGGGGHPGAAGAQISFSEYPDINTIFDIVLNTAKEQR